MERLVDVAQDRRTIVAGPVEGELDLVRVRRRRRRRGGRDVGLPRVRHQGCEAHVLRVEGQRDAQPRQDLHDLRAEDHAPPAAHELHLGSLKQLHAGRRVAPDQQPTMDELLVVIGQELARLRVLDAKSHGVEL